MVNIEFKIGDDEYLITSDNLQYIMKRKYIGKDKNKNEKEMQTTVGYYPFPKDLLKKLQFLFVNNEELTSIYELTIAIRKSEKFIMEMAEKLAGGMK